MEGFLRDIHKRLAIYLHELNHLTLMLARPNTFWGQLCQEPQAAYNALTKSFQIEWTSLQCVNVANGCDSSFFDLESTIFSWLLPVLFGCKIII